MKTIHPFVCTENCESKEEMAAGNIDKKICLSNSTIKNSHKKKAV